MIKLQLDAAPGVAFGLHAYPIGITVNHEPGERGDSFIGREILGSRGVVRENGTHTVVLNRRLKFQLVEFQDDIRRPQKWIEPHHRSHDLVHRMLRSPLDFAPHAPDRALFFHRAVNTVDRLRAWMKYKSPLLRDAHAEKQAERDQKYRGQRGR